MWGYWTSLTVLNIRTWGTDHPPRYWWYPPTRIMISSNTYHDTPPRYWIYPSSTQDIPLRYSECYPTILNTPWYSRYPLPLLNTHHTGMHDNYSPFKMLRNEQVCKGKGITWHLQYSIGDYAKNGGQGQSDFHVIFTMILCGTNFCIW